ncbi:hypothetical protein QUF99_15130 [Bacillus sp. DX4.1]|uniref:hypothetical protein n=1 Tax=Bacillus sp. DX4.1 TaxID=3055867 RepID=UPI0025A1572C|nr:hypothetical protein [Bacillus sp. DX4.1]MDM5188601.1 hypothetical protein [Bacillus sp. DX4.1]
MEELTKLPSDKQALLDVKNYEVYNRDVIRKVFPRIIKDIRELKPKLKIGDIIPFYIVLLTYIDGNVYRKDGTPNNRFGACFLSRDAIADHTGIDKKRHAFLSKILEVNGLITTKSHYEGTNRYKWYFPSFCPQVTDEGYVVNTDGEVIVPNYSDVKFPSYR